MGGAAGLRYHVLGLLDSPFVGVAGGYHYGFGRNDLGLELPAARLAIHTPDQGPLAPRVHLG